MSKPDPSILSMGPHVRRGGGRQPTLPSLPELEDTPGALQGEEGDGDEGGGLGEKENGTATETDSKQKDKLLTTL